MPAGDGVRGEELLGWQGRGGPSTGEALLWIHPMSLPAASCQGVKDGVFRQNLTLPHAAVWDVGHLHFLHSWWIGGTGGEEPFTPSRRMLPVLYSRGFISVAPNAQRRIYHPGPYLRCLWGERAHTALHSRDPPRVMAVLGVTASKAPRCGVTGLFFRHQTQLDPGTSETPPKRQPRAPQPWPGGSPICSPRSFPGPGKDLSQLRDLHSIFTLYLLLWI